MRDNDYTPAAIARAVLVRMVLLILYMLGAGLLLSTLVECVRKVAL